MQTRCRITGGDVAGSELAMLPLNVKSKEWQQRPLLGSQVHVSNQVDDLTTTPEDFLFHPELLHVQFFGPIYSPQRLTLTPTVRPSQALHPATPRASKS